MEPRNTRRCGVIQPPTGIRRARSTRGSPGSEVTPRVPTTEHTVAASKGIQAANVAAMTDTVGGPTVKLISSLTASRACDRSRSARSVIPTQRTRVRALTLGTVKPAAIASETISHVIGANLITISSPIELTTKAARRRRAMYRWPNRSMSCPTTGFSTAPARLNPAEANPATPYEPEAASPANTRPTGNMETGNRPTRPNHRSGRAPGMRSRLRYSDGPDR